MLFLEKKLEELKKREKNLLNNIKNFQENWVHRRPCEDYIKIGFCQHLVRAERHKFGEEIRGIFSEKQDLIRSLRS